MYQKSDWEENRQQLKRRVLALLIPMAVLIAGIVISLLPNIRLQWLTITLTIVGGAIAIFCYGLFISPVLSYGRHLKNVLEGRKRETTGLLVSFGSQSCFREGVEYYPMIINVGDKGDEADDRLFYFDVHKGMPPYKPGDMITVVSHDKAVADIRKAE